MGDLIRFPQERRQSCIEDYRAEPAIILILPVVRVERCDDREHETTRRWIDLGAF